MPTTACPLPPRAFYIHRMVTQKEAERIIDIARPDLERSQVVDPKGDKVSLPP